MCVCVGGGGGGGGGGIKFNILVKRCNLCEQNMGKLSSTIFEVHCINTMTYTVIIILLLCYSCKIDIIIIIFACGVLTRYLLLFLKL